MAKRDPSKGAEDGAGMLAPTPMMAQYIEIKTANPDCLLFYRMGDFYELFFDDAEIASRALGITLTKRGKHAGGDIPMCGVPVHAADDYLQKLIKLGHRVAVCEQTEDPAEAKKRGAKSVVRREVVRLVTPGTITEDNLLEPGKANFLAGLAVQGQRGQGEKGQGQKGQARFGLAWLDISTGDFRTTATDINGIAALLARIDPAELLVPDVLLSDEDMRPHLAFLPSVQELPKALFDGATAARRISAYYNVQSLDGFGHFDRVELMAAAGLVSYLERTQLAARPPLRPLRRESDQSTLLIDQAALTNLEMVKTQNGERQGSLLHAIDRTKTAAGARLLAERLTAPSTDPDDINHRLDGVDWLLHQRALREAMRSDLARAPDLERALSRLVMERGGPRDLQAIAAALDAASHLVERFVSEGQSQEPPARIKAALQGLQEAPRDLSDLLQAALAEDLPLLKRDGGFVCAGYRADLDELKALATESRQVIASLQADYAALADLKSLKVKHNNQIGYFVEVPAQHGEKLLSEPLCQTFIHRQTMAGALRFSTTELSGLEARISSAGVRSLAIEHEVFDALCAAVFANQAALNIIADAFAELDVFASHATLAEAENYVRPSIDSSLTFQIEGGRHPVVEQALRKSGDRFVANRCVLGSDTDTVGQLTLITGPNMGGKSTYLRQNALIAILAQMGCFVPAKAAHIGVVDQVFSRVGAADDLARGRSTFMVEMVETAAILNRAGPKSLVILDEIGRGTATYDGLSIAWAVVEHLQRQNKCRALFATHYHELTALAKQLDHVQNATLKVREWEGEVIFLHEVSEGTADRSYGIQVARLAGLPNPVVKRAKAVLNKLETLEPGQSAKSVLDELPLFAASTAPLPDDGPSVDQDPSLQLLDELDPDSLSPREALDALYRLKETRAK